MKAAFACLTVALALASASASHITDTDILNFALNLECLEAEFYSWAAFGKGLTAAQRGDGPASIGGKKATLGDYQGIAEEIAREEIAHVEFLRAALGAAAVPCPLLDIGAPFATAYNVAMGTTLSPPLSPYASPWKFLLGALLFEDVGVTAYDGAIDLLKTPAFATAGRKIQTIEAYHGGVIRHSLAEAARRTTRYGKPSKEFTDAIGPVLSSLLGLPAGALTVGDLDKPVMAPSDSNGLAYGVTYDKILNVVYLGSSTTPGGFFPNGLNGLLK